MGLSDLMGAMRRGDEDGLGGRKLKRLDRLNVGLNKFLLTGGSDTEVRDPGFHVSEMCFFCPRSFVLNLLFPGEAKPRVPDVALQRIFDAGHMYHDWYQNRYLGPAGVLKGTWACLRCDHQHEGFMPKKCRGCKVDRGYLKFREPLVLDRSLGVTFNGIELFLVGHSDGIIQLEEDEEEQVLELKTMEPDKWVKLEEPPFWNVHQIQIYMHLLGKKRGRLVYINKNLNQTKEFVIQYDAGPWHDVESKIGSLQRFFRQVNENGGVVEPKWVWQVRGPCKDPTARAAQSCVQAGACFAPRPKSIDTVFAVSELVAEVEES